uniref:uncharacterized protein DDB_G0271670 n=1 Tax=Scatophagus argus TaxID=75038 RepID=UPI001ED80A1D|nr:uncharacterized protein DDB_G0271670 [Scatophagus argus]
MSRVPPTSIRRCLTEKDSLSFNGHNSLIRTTHSTTEDSVFSDHHPDHRYEFDHDKTRHSHSHHYHRKENHRHVSLSETPLSSSTGSSSSSSSSSSSTSSCSSSSSSSSSFSSSSSTSSSSLSSETSSECFDSYALKKLQHSQSCTDISRKHKYFEEGDDTAPLIDKSGYPNKLPPKQEQEKGKPSHSGSTQGTLKNTRRITRGLGNDGSFRKAKSLEALTGPNEREWHGNEEGNEKERRKGEAMKNLIKEKQKFSAFLNEITRQVLSPMRLTTLGVTDAQRPSSPGQASVRSSKANSSTEKLRQQRSRPTSPDSNSSSKYSHTSKHSCNTITILAIIITITDTTTVLPVILQTTAAQLIITTKTTTVQAIIIAMGTITVQAITINMEMTTVQAIILTMETTTL